MNEALVYMAAAGFLISVFPIHICNYIYINTEEKYASLNVTVYRYFRLYNINTVKDKPNVMQVNGKDKPMSLKGFKMNLYRIFNQICIFKIIQLSDFGLKNQNNAYIALAQNSISTTVYKLLQVNGNYTKLRNYTVLNEEHSSVRYYAKMVTVINLLVITKIIINILMEKLYEQTQKK